VRRLFSALLLPILASPALAQEVTTATLGNGMEVMVVEDHRAPVAVHMVWYKTGSADEPPGVSGVAHFLEHLLFKATDDLEAGEFSRIVAENGGTDNAFTSYDYTAYHQRVAADRLELMMQMEADRMNDLRLTPEDIETEREVILEERSQRVDSEPGSIAREQMRAAQFLNHRYGQPVIGWRHEMQALDMEDVLATYDLWYSPNNAILVVAGDVEPQEVLAMAQRHYGVIPAEPGLPERVRTQEPPQLAARRVTYEDPRVPQPYLVRSYIAPARDSGEQEEAAALVYLAEILGGSSFTSVLAEKLTFEQDLALRSGAGYDGTALDDATFGLSLTPRPGITLGEAEAAMDQVLAEFLEEGVNPAQLERIRTQLRAAEIYALDSVTGLANRYGSGLATGLTIEDMKAWPEVLQAVTAEDIMEVAREVLDERSSVTLYVSAPEAQAAATEPAPEPTPAAAPAMTPEPVPAEEASE
jgi:zinc protease